MTVRRPLVWLSVAALRRAVEPLACPVWIGTTRIPVAEILARMAAGGFARPVPCDPSAAEPRSLHIERVATYAALGWEDAPILVFVKSMFGEPWSIDDGHHRLGAAIVREQKTILAEVENPRTWWMRVDLADVPREILATEDERAHDLARGLTGEVTDAAIQTDVPADEAVA